MTTRVRRVRRAEVVRAAVTAVVLAVLVGCSAIPLDGDVQVGVEGVSEQGAVMPLGERPEIDASPEAIVQGFLLASAAGFNGDATTDVNNDFTVAREYLAPEVRGTWKPREKVVVYPTSSIPDITLVSEAQVQVRLSVTARVDARGQYAETAASAQESLVFDLVRDGSGQWRISDLEDGVVLSQPIFDAVYRSAAIYFLSADKTYLVPETRWFPVRNLATSVVQALLAGPSEWLRDAVHTAVPSGVHLTPDAVRVLSDGTAEVGLSGAALADTASRLLLRAQLEATLRVPGVSSVEATAGGVPLQSDPPVDPPTLERGVDVDTVPEMIQGDTLMALVQGALTPVAEVGSLAGLDARDPARNDAGDVRVMLSGPDTLVLAPTPAAPAVPLWSAPGLVAPSVDRHGWAWTASAEQSLGLTAVRPDGALTAVSADWLAGRTVRAVRVARDGTRVAVVSVGPDGVAVDVAGIVRDRTGAPQQLGEPLGVGARLADSARVVWIDDTALGVLGRSENATVASYYRVPLAGQTRSMSTLDDIVSIAGGRGERGLYAQTSDGRLMWRSGASWAVVATDVRDPVLPG